MKPEQSVFVEESGRFWENVGMARTVGRLIGWLMICEPAHQSSADLMEALQVSAGSVSTQIRMLEQIGMAERVTFRGDRARYYQLPDQGWIKLMEGEVGRMERLRYLATCAEQALPKERPDRVTELAAVTDFFIGEWPDLLGRLNKHLERPT